MIFSASYGTSTKISTALIVLIFAAVIAFEFFDEGSGSPRFILMLLGTFVFVVVLSYFFSVKHFEITDSELIIHKPFSKTIYKKADISSVQLIDRKLLRYAIRTFGIGGVFGYYGEFYTGKLGSMTWYRTRLDNPVLIETGKAKIVVSPDHPQEFIDALKS